MCVNVSLSKKKSEEGYCGFILSAAKYFLKASFMEYMKTYVCIPIYIYIYIFHLNIKFLCVKIVFLTTSSYCESTKKASGLDPIADVEYRIENTPDRLFGRSWARRPLFIFVSFAKAANAPQTKWSLLQF